MIGSTIILSFHTDLLLDNKLFNNNNTDNHNNNNTINSNIINTTINYTNNIFTTSDYSPNINIFNNNNNNTIKSIIVTTTSTNDNSDIINTTNSYTNISDYSSNTYNITDTNSSNCIFNEFFSKIPKDDIIHFNPENETSFQKYIEELDKIRNCLHLFDKHLATVCNEDKYIQYNSPSNSHYCLNQWGYKKSNPCIIFTYNKFISFTVFNHLQYTNNLNISCRFSNPDFTEKWINFKIIKNSD